MRRVVVAALMCLVAVSPAAAVGLVGTPLDDVIAGTQAADRIAARAGADRISVWGDGRRDRVNCGTGLDLVNAELNDILGSGCETVARQVSRDRTRIDGPQHGSQAEPDSSSWGDTIVTVFQTGRYVDGGAAAVGYATSADAGATWQEGLVPPHPGYSRQTDPVVAYDATRNTWLAATLGLTDVGGTALLISTSSGGVDWSEPIVAAAETDPEGGLDKEWIVCDNGVSSPFVGRCYLAASDLTLSTVQLQTSLDGGQTWSKPVYPLRTSPQGVLGAYPVVRPDGELIVFLLDGGEGPEALRSPDGGGRLLPVAGVFGGEYADLDGVRSSQLIAADVSPRGRVYAVWAECGLRPACSGNDVVLTESDDGVTWRPRRRLPTQTSGSAFMPTIAVDPSSGRIGVVYYAGTECAKRCTLDAWLIESPDGVAWTKPVRLSARSMALPWIARSSGGAMLGDYVSLSYVRGRPMSALVLAQQPLPGRFRQATFVVTAVARALRIVR